MPVHKNTAHDVPFALIRALDGAALTGATVNVYRSIDGGAQEAGGGSVTELGNGQYVYEGVAADFNGNYTVGFLFESTESVPVHILFQMTYFRGDTAYDIPFLLLNVNTSKGLTGASPSGLRCLDGAAQEAVSGTFSELGLGQYVFEANVSDFNAEDIAGFLITASNGVPVHLIIDLLESYSPTDGAVDSPAAVIASYLTGQALMTVPSAGGDWPLYIQSVPDVPDNAGVIFNTTPIKDGRIMATGSVIQHYGIQISIRCRDDETGWDKSNVLAGKLDAIHNVDVSKSGNSYRIHNVTRMGGINSLGVEEGTRKRNWFSMNFLVAMSNL